MIILPAFVIPGVFSQYLAYLGDKCESYESCAGELVCCSRHYICKLPDGMCQSDSDCAQDEICLVDRIVQQNVDETITHEPTEEQCPVVVNSVPETTTVYQTCSDVKWTITNTYYSELVYQTTGCEAGPSETT
jgi:hypothetical protein